MINEIGRAIARNTFDDKRKKEDENKPSDPAILGKDGAGTWNPIYNPNSPEYNPAVVPPDDENFPGKNGAGTRDITNDTNDTNHNNIDYNDEMHLMEYELNGIIEGLSIQESTLEDSLVQIEKLNQTVA